LLFQERADGLRRLLIEADGHAPVAAILVHMHAGLGVGPAAAGPRHPFALRGLGRFTRRGSARGGHLGLRLGRVAGCIRSGFGFPWAWHVFLSCRCSGRWDSVADWQSKALVLISEQSCHGYILAGLGT